MHFRWGAFSSLLPFENTRQFAVLSPNCDFPFHFHNYSILRNRTSKFWYLPFISLWCALYSKTSSPHPKSEWFFFLFGCWCFMVFAFPFWSRTGFEGICLECWAGSGSLLLLFLFMFPLMEKIFFQSDFSIFPKETFFSLVTSVNFYCNPNGHPGVGLSLHSWGTPAFLPSAELVEPTRGRHMEEGATL